MGRTAHTRQKIWRVIDLINWAEDYFNQRGFEHPRMEIEWLLRDLLNCTRLDLYLRYEEPLSSSQLETLRGWVTRRLEKEPLEYITGTAEFFGRVYKVSPAVLIPRPETERVVEVAIHTVGNQAAPRILDVGTGSGCIGITLAKEFPSASVTAIDISDEILEIAQQNARSHSATNIFFARENFLTDDIEGPFDLIVSNPPYIPVNELSVVMKDVQDFEPHEALTDDGDGLSFYKRFAEVATKCVRSGGYLVSEVGLGEHPKKAADCFKSDRFIKIEFVQDYNGDDRVLKIQVK